MNAQTAALRTTAPQTPSLPTAKPEAIGLSSTRLQTLSDAFKREVDKGTLPGATVLVARKGQIGWFDAIGRQSPTASAPMTHPPPARDDDTGLVAIGHDNPLLVSSYVRAHIVSSDFAVLNLV